MFEQIEITDEVPRDPEKQIKRIDLTKGLKPLYFFGIFFSMAITLPFVLYITAKGGVTDAKTLISFVVSDAFATGAGTLILLTGMRRSGKRRAAFINGRVTEARVTGTGRALVFWKSFRDYTVTVEFTDSAGGNVIETVRSSDPELHKRYPAGSSMKFLYFDREKASWFPAESGLEIRL